MSALSFLAQIPTPTPLPPGTPIFDVPYDLWAAAPSAVYHWQSAQYIGIAPVIQIIALVSVVILGVRLLVSFFRWLTGRDSEE